ncbi:MAG: hypothetical protein V3V53_14285 [Bacteroidales bacterium]
MKAASIISIVYGTLGLIWATVITIVIRVSAAFFEHFPWPPEVYEVIDMPAMLDSVYGLIGNIFPYIFLIAILYIISGILHLAGKTSYKNIAYAAAILNIVWYVVYMVLVQVEIVPVLNTLELFPKNLLAVLVVLGMIINAVFYCGYPIFLIIFVKKGGKEWDTLNTGYKS